MWVLILELKKGGVAPEVSTAYSPVSNVKVERLNRTLLYLARTMILSNKVCRSELWAEAIATECFIRNRLVTKECRESCTLFEMLHLKRPYVAFIRTVDRKLFVYKPKKATRKV